MEEIVQAAQVAQTLTTGLHQQHLQRQVTQTQQRLERILQSSLDVIVTTQGNQVALISPSCKTILGHEPAEMMGQGFMRFVHPEDTGKTREAMRRLQEGQEVVCFENRYLHKDGHEVHLEGTA